MSIKEFHETDRWQDEYGRLIVKCVWCGNYFVGERPTASFCTGNHRLQYHRAQQAIKRDIQQANGAIVRIVESGINNRNSPKFQALKQIMVYIANNLYNVES